MNKASPALRKIAAHLILHAEEKLVEDTVVPAFPVIDTLRPHLANLMGDGGVRALLARALVLASAEVPWLQRMRVDTNGHLEGLEALSEHLAPADLFNGRVVLLAQLIGLLVAFIGPSLSTRLIGEVWPQLPLEERDLGKEYNDE